MVTAKGNPSGTATTTTVIPIIKNEIKELRVEIVKIGSLFMILKTIKLIMEAMTVIIATQRPTLPIWSPIIDSLAYKGVNLSSVVFNAASAIPCQLFLPTALTIATPVPWTMFDPPKRKTSVVILGSSIWSIPSFLR